MTICPFCLYELLWTLPFRILIDNLLNPWKNIVYLQILKGNLQFKLMKYCVPNIFFGSIDLSIEIGFNYFPQVHTWTYKIKATVMLSLCFYGLNYVSNLFVFMLSFIYILCQNYIFVLSIAGLFSLD